MEFLPGEREQGAVVDNLAAIIDAQGFETFVAAPLVEPDARFFPDPWEPSARGVRALALRLLRYAGGDHRDARVTLYGESRGCNAHEGAVAWFSGIKDGTCVFGVHMSQLREHDAIVGTLCHEVAHAYRAWTGLMETDDPLEEQKTDLTTVYLGFGLLTTNNTYRFRKQGLGGNIFAGIEWSTSETGYLSPQTMAFALAAQVTARGMSLTEVKRLGRLLEPNQQVFFRAACKRFRADIGNLRARLGLPGMDLWPEPWPLRLDPLPSNARFDPRDGTWKPPRFGGWNEGRNVFRVRERQTSPFALTGAVLGSLAGGISYHWPQTDLIWAVITGGVLGAIALGWVGSRRMNDLCSDQDCKEVRLPADATSCPQCGGRIRGVIQDRNERLAAEEALPPDLPLMGIPSGSTEPKGPKRIELS
jgi:hypothetical protein